MLFKLTGQYITVSFFCSSDSLTTPFSPPIATLQ